MGRRRRTKEIKVLVVSYGDDRNLALRYYDPQTGKAVVKTSGTRNRKQAMKEAALRPARLWSGRSDWRT